MAITRCPYCHAIIDENDKYCNNCGTQLLFSEDEEIEEEIPGEKIVDAEVEEKDYTVDEPEDEKRPAPAKDLDSEIDEELAQELREETEEMALDELVAEEARKAGEEDVTEEVILVDEIEAAEAAGQNGSKALAEEGPAGSKTAEPEAAVEEEKDEEKEEEEEDEEEVEEEDEEEEEEEELADGPEDEEDDEAVEEETETKEETREYATAALNREAEAARVPETPAPPEDEPVVEYVSEAAAPDEAATAGEAAFRPATFDSKELESLGRTVELSKEKVDKFLEGLAENQTPPPPAVEPTPAAAPVPQTGSLPPWASTMKGAPVFAEDTGSVETRKFRGGEPAIPEPEEEVEIFPKRRAADSTIGLPEKVSQAPLPFGAPAPGEEAEDEDAGDEAADETMVRDLTPEQVVRPAGQARPFRAPAPAAAPGGEIEAPEELEEPEPRPPFSFSVFFKSKAFDVLFVGLFWLVALWLAAASLGVTLFAILGSMSGPMLLLYAVFIVIYFFLFKFFLGETLGDRLFRPRE